MIIFLSISLNMCFGCSKEPSHQDGLFEYPQHIFSLRNKKIIFSYTLISGCPNLMAGRFLYHPYRLKDRIFKPSVLVPCRMSPFHNTWLDVFIEIFLSGAKLYIKEGLKDQLS